MTKLLIAAACLFTALPALAATDIAVVPGPVLGEAAVENGNTKVAREAALHNAMRDALQRGAGAVIDSASLVEGGTLVQDRIFVHANGYIKSYDIGTDGVEDGVYNVSISNVHVGLGDLSKDMAAVHAMLMQHAHPRLYMLIREQSIESTGSGSGKDPAPLASLSQGITEQRIASQLAAVGWHIVDPEVASGKVHVENALTTDLAGMNGRDFATTGAEFVALGSVVVRPMSAGEGSMGARSVELRAVIKIKATDTGETVASVEDSKTVPGIDYVTSARKALEQAGDEVTAALSKQVLENWRKRDNGVGQLHLHVAVADYEILQALEAQIQKGVANVKGVDEVSFNDGKADLAVSVAGTNSKQLAGSLSNKSVKGMQIKVTKVTANTVEVKLVK